MIDTYLRNIFQTACSPSYLRKLSQAKISPHLYTLGALICGLSITPALAYQKIWIALCLLLASGFLDTVDGSVARAKNQATPEGAIFDIVSDRIVETAIIFGLYFVDPESRGLLCLLMLGSILLCITTFLVVGIFVKNTSEKGFYYSPGIIERSEAFIFFGAMILFRNYFFYISILFSALVLITALVRIWQFSRHQHT